MANITIKKIAELAGVSPGTVDRIIHKRGEVSQENIDKVNAIIKASGYKKNIFASQLAINKTFQFGIFIPQASGLDYWKLPVKGIEKAARELANFGVQCNYFYYPYTPEGFAKGAKDVLSADLDGLLFAPVFYEASKNFIQEFQKRKIPTMLIDAQIEGYQHAYIGQDARQSGYLAGRLVSMGLPKSSRLIIVKIARDIDSTSTFLQRTKGFYDFFTQNNPHDYLIDEITVKGETSLHPSLWAQAQALFVPNSRAHLVAEAQKLHASQPIRLVGFDLLPKNIELMKAGYIDFLINQKPETQGYQGIQYLYKSVVLGEKPPLQQWMPLDIIVRENCDFTQY